LNRFDFEKLLDEVTFNFSRSGGKGGQNVNKVETKVEIVFDIAGSASISDEVKEILKNKLSGRLDKEGKLHIVSQTERTQSGNRKKVVEKFQLILRNALKKEKKRKKTKKPKVVKEKILEAKRKHSEKKKERKKVEFSEKGA
jgi:ribosome-associated protein